MLLVCSLQQGLLVIEWCCSCCWLPRFLCCSAWVQVVECCCGWFCGSPGPALICSVLMGCMLGAELLVLIKAWEAGSLMLKRNNKKSDRAGLSWFARHWSLKGVGYFAFPFCFSFASFPVLWLCSFYFCVSCRGVSPIWECLLFGERFLRVGDCSGSLFVWAYGFLADMLCLRSHQEKVFLCIPSFWHIYTSYLPRKQNIGKQTA